jgi:hypothetical protein
MLRAFCEWTANFLCWHLAFSTRQCPRHQEMLPTGDTSRLARSWVGNDSDREAGGGLQGLWLSSENLPCSSVSDTQFQQLFSMGTDEKARGVFAKGREHFRSRRLRRQTMCRISIQRCCYDRSNRHKANHIMTTDDELIAARKRAEEYRKMAEEECPDGGFLFGDDPEPFERES